MQAIEMNLNVARARTIMGVVSGLTGVDTYLLLEDSEFCALLTRLANEKDLAGSYDVLVEYVNNNY